MSFVAKGNLFGNDGRMVMGGHDNTPMSTLIKNSATVQIGDMVTMNDAGFIARVAETEPVLGVVIGVAQKAGIIVEPDSGTTDTFTMASDNQTVAMKYAIIDVSPYTIYSANVTGTIGTTVASGRPLAWCDVTDQNDIKETSCSRTITAGGQVLSLGTDPDNTARLLCVLNESFFKSTLSGVASGTYQAA